MELSLATSILDPLDNVFDTQCHFRQQTNDNLGYSSVLTHVFQLSSPAPL